MAESERVKAERERRGKEMERREKQFSKRKGKGVHSRKTMLSHGLESVTEHYATSGTSIAGRKQELSRATEGYKTGKGGYNVDRYK